MKAQIKKNKVIKYSQLPNVYGGIINFRKASLQVHQKNGFFEVVKPVISKHQSLIDLIPSDLKGVEFLHRVYNFTQAEIDEVKDIETDAETDSIILDGKELHTEIRRRIVRAHKKGNLTDAQIATIKTFLKPAIAPLKDGDWIDAQALVNALPIPGNPTLLTVLNEVKNLINTYIIDNNIII